ncbi:hypothetical protein D9758_012678 [Tetrapyrgos nigripes]|uniref:Transposase family Tnp2 protein n=1 Tax=Tetrapyrgos nigripes TaxID=182062 RepID=A0A8H5CYN4_9AGAR|nr:hypothetical protein D9758_012678 [Tetrapyrgos nigripes]
MPRSAKQWCEHCQKHISQQRANEHWAFLFNPYTTARLPSGSTTASEAPGNYENTEYWNEPFNDEEAFLPEDNHLPNPAHLQNIRAWVEDGDEDEDLMDMDGWTTRELDDKDESDSEDEEEDFDWDGFVRRYCVSSGNLSPEDRLGAAFEQEASAATLAEYDLAICRAFAYKLTTHTTDRAFAKTPYAFPRHPSQLPLPKLDGIRSRVTALSGVVPRLFDCCPNSCCAYTGRHADLDTCPYCHGKRFRANGKPRKQFTYIPLIPRLQAFTRSTDMVEKMQYRAREHKHKAGHLNDIFDGTTYRKLHRRHVHINHTPLPHKYFEDERDCALGLSTDGFAPHKCRKKTAWPLIIFNYNLPPDICFHVEHILSLGVIPGPKKPHDIDSFLWPLLEELSLLARGVCAYDVLNNVIFSLRAYLIAVFGDIPAVSMLMHMKGHNAKSPCRMCSISGVAGPDSRTYYVPLNRKWNIGDDDGNNIIQAYDPHSLPMHTHADLLAQAAEVQAATSNMQAERLSRAYGIKEIPALSFLNSLIFPTSFPYDFMHLIWENLVKNLILHWTSDFKGLDEGSESYTLGKAVWEAIGSETAASGATIPSAFAEMWSFWTMYLGPVLLHKCLGKKYYDHFLLLVKLLTKCLQFEITTEEVNEIRMGFIEWIQKYEKYYYQYSAGRVSACPLTIHALLHIANSIEVMGPLWCYWAFPMERYCGSLQPAIRSRHYPYRSLDRYVLETAQLSQIKLRYNVCEELKLGPSKVNQPQGSSVLKSDSAIILCPPKAQSKQDHLSAGLVTAVCAALVTRFDSRNITIRVVRKHFQSAHVEVWGCIRQVDSEEGETIRASHVGGIASEDSRDATFVQYEAYVDLHARKKNHRRKMVLQQFYGQLERIIVVSFSDPDACRVLRVSAGEEICLAGIRSCKLDNKQPLRDVDMYFYSSTGALDVIGIESIQCLMGRVKNRNKTGWL